MIEQIIYGVLTGAGYSLAGWRKGVSQDDYDKKSFKWMKLGKSLVICGIIGAVAGGYNKDFNFLMTGGMGVAVTNIVSIGWKIVSNWFKLA